MKPDWLMQELVHTGTGSNQSSIELGVTKTCLGVAKELFQNANQQGFDQYEQSRGQAYARHISPWECITVMRNDLLPGVSQSMIHHSDLNSQGKNKQIQREG